MKILLVENDPCLQETISHILRKEGYLVSNAQNDNTALEMVSTDDYDTILLDLDNALLPNRAKISLLKEFNNIKSETAIILLATSSTPSDYGEFLGAGAADYLVKPFFVDELLSRLKLLASRKPNNLTRKRLEVAGLILEPLAGQVTTRIKTISLTTKETSLLELLMQNYGVVLSKEYLIEKIWGYSSYISATNVNLHIFYLRKKLGHHHIKTVRGFGYCFKGYHDDMIQN